MVAHQHPIRRIQDILERLITDEMPEDLHQKGTNFFWGLQNCISISAQWAVKIAMRTTFKRCPAIRKRGTVGQIGPYLSKKLQFQTHSYPRLTDFDECMSIAMSGKLLSIRIFFITLFTCIHHYILLSRR